VNKFAALIEQLGHTLGIRLQAEKESMCTLRMKDKVKVQIEYDDTADRIVLLCFVAEVPPGKFREETLITALQANFHDTSLGFFAYLDKMQTLVLQMYLPLSTGPSLLGTLLEQFTAKGIEWKEAVESGRVSQKAPSKGGSLPSPMNFS